MSKLLVKNKEIVAPGEVLAEGMEYLPGEGTYRLRENVMADRLGLLIVDGKVLKTIPMAGKYLPKEGDTVIARVIDILMTGWRVDLNSPYSAVLSLKEATHKYIERDEDLSKYFALDDYIVCKIIRVTTQNLVDVTCKGPNLQKLKGGRVFKVNPQKVPRIIGKKGSMVSMIKRYTDCQITVGQNGLVWVDGEPDNEIIAIDAIEKIERESHLSGLTEDIEDFLKKNTKSSSKKSDDKSKGSKE